MSLTLEVVGQALLDLASGNYDPEHEKRINSFENQPGYLTSLIQLLLTPSAPQVIRISAAIRIRRFTERRWTIGTVKDPTLNLIPDQDRANLKTNLINLILTEQNSTIQGLLISTVYSVARQDYPTTWNVECVGPICTALTQNQPSVTNPKQLFGALSSLYQLLKTRRAACTNPREKAIQSELITNTHGPILSILTQLLQQEESCIQAGNEETTYALFQLTHICVKIISVSFQQCTMDFYKNPKNPEPVNTFTKCLFQCARASHLQYAMHLYQQQGERVFQHTLFKRRRWAFRVLARIARGSLKVTSKDRSQNSPALQQVKWNQQWQNAFFKEYTSIILNSLFELTIPGYTSTPLHPNTTTTPIQYPTLQIQPNGFNYRPILDPNTFSYVLRSLRFIVDPQTKAFNTKPIYNNYLKPHMHTILQSVHSIFTLQAYDLATLDENPVFFIDSVLQHGLVDGCNDIYAATDDFLKCLTVTRNTLLPTILDQVITQPLQQYHQITSLPQPTQDQIQTALITKDATLRIFGALSSTFNHPKFLPNTVELLNQLATQHINGPVPATQSPLLQIRSMWCWQRFRREVQEIIRQGTELDQNDTSEKAQLVRQLQPPLLQNALKLASLSLSYIILSPEMKQWVQQTSFAIALRAQGASTLLFLLQVPQVSEAVLPFSTQLFCALLELLEELENEQVSVLFQRLIVHYREHLFPVAEVVLSRLIPKFMSLFKESGETVTYDENGFPIIDLGSDENDYDEEAEEKYWAAQALLSSMHSVLNAVGDSAEALAMSERYLVPLVDFIVSGQYTDHLHEVLIIVQCLTYYGQLTPALWTLFPKLMGMLIHGWGVESFEDALPCLVNFFSKDQSYRTVKLAFTEADNKTVIETTPIALVYRLCWQVFDSEESTQYDHRLQECAVHLLRTHICWLPSESQLQLAEITEMIQIFIPKLFPMLTLALELRLLPSMIKTRDEKNAVAQELASKAETPEKAKEIYDLNCYKPKLRFKFALLLLDCIHALIFKYPSFLIPMLATAPAPQEAQIPTPDQQPITCLQFILDCIQQVMSSASRDQSIATHIIGLATLLQWFSRSAADVSTPQISLIRSNIVTALFNTMLRYQEVETEEDDESDIGTDDDGDDDYDNDIDYDDDNEGELLEAQAAQAETDRQQRDLLDYAELARKHAETSHDLYYNDSNFISPLDNVNFYELFVVSINSWITNAQQFQHIQGPEGMLLQGLTTPTSDVYANLHPLILYSQESRELWDQEHAEEERAYQERLAIMKNLREQQIAQMQQQQQQQQQSPLPPQ